MVGLPVHARTTSSVQGLSVVLISTLLFDVAAAPAAVYRVCGLVVVLLPVRPGLMCCRPQCFMSCPSCRIGLSPSAQQVRM